MSYCLSCGSSCICPSGSRSRSSYSLSVKGSLDVVVALGLGFGAVPDRHVAVALAVDLAVGTDVWLSTD